MDAHRGGHNFKTTGAEGYISEVVEVKKIDSHISQFYKDANRKHLNVNPPDYYGANDINYSINLANSEKADFYYSIHMNYYNKTSSPMGVEVIVFNDKQLVQAKRVLNNLVGLGFKNRGVKTMSEVKRTLGELKNTKMPAMIIEVCFVDSLADVELYKKIGSKRIAQAIYEGVTNTKVNNTQTSDKLYRVCTGSFKNRDNAVIEMNKLKAMGIDAFINE